MKETRIEVERDKEASRKATKQIKTPASIHHPQGIEPQPEETSEEGKERKRSPTRTCHLHLVLLFRVLDFELALLRLLLMLKLDLSE